MVEPPHDVDSLFVKLVETRAIEGDHVDTDQVNELTHALQCAATLAEWRPDDHELQVAGLVHDLGHLAVPDNPEDHGRAGADLVRPLLGPRIADLVELHVVAKRYLVTRDPAYRAQLSPGSTHTLALQGGALDDDERARFEAHLHSADALVLRRADEAAKDPTRQVPDLDHWRPLVEAIGAATP